MTIWTTSDLHFDHKNILQYTKRTEHWQTIEEMNEGLIERHNSVVKPGDSVYFIGDIIFGQHKTLPERMESYFSRMNGQKFLVKGNHDHNHKEEWFKKHFVWIRDYYELRVDDKDAANGRFNKLVLCHFPLYSWHGMGQGWWHIHGHCHGSIDVVNRETTRLDVGVDAEFSNLTPLSYEQIKEIMSKKTVKTVDHHGNRNL
jgi:calcineurin-like phosphoesterase family protein